MEFRPTSAESLTEATDAANSSAPSSSANSSVSNVSVEPVALANSSIDSARALFRERSQLVNYIKAGIEEGKRQARKYIRMALSFGVKSGYLIPTDPRGSVLRVCPTLANSKAADAESRRRRRVARRGETRLTTIGDRKAMRRGIPRSRQDATAETETSRKKGNKRRFVESPARSSSTSDPRKSPGRSASRERKKSKTVGKRKKADNMARRGKQRKRNDGRAKSYVKRPAKRRRMALFPKHGENNHEPVEKCYENASNEDPDRCESNEDNYGAIAERRKSTSCREDGSRTEKREPEMNVDDDRDAECGNDDNDDDNNDDDDDEKSEEASVERDANGTTGGTNA